MQAAQQIASLVNLSRAALRYADSINRVTLVKTLFDQESIHLKPTSPRTSTTRLRSAASLGPLGRLRSRLGPSTVVASNVNGIPGLWVGFQIEKDNYGCKPIAARSSQ